MSARFKKLSMVAGCAVLVLLSLRFFSSTSEGAATPFRTTTIEKGALHVVVAATGTVQPEEVIDVGAQVAGQIREFGVDGDGKSIDFGSRVAAGSVLALIDDSVYTAQVTEARAQTSRAEANVTLAQARLNQASSDWNRAKLLAPSQALSKSDIDKAKADFEVAQATVTVAQAELSQAQAGLERAQRNLDYCTIRSPVDGVIIDRRVNIGQTVVASFSAPSLFLIAKDLRRMEIWAAVNEADVGKIFPGQKAEFTVDALPGEVFEGKVKKIRLNAAMTQNVVTYTVEVAADNSQEKLLPYLTANIRFQVASRADVLTVSNSALQFTPEINLIKSEFRSSIDAAKGELAQSSIRKSASEPDAFRKARLWRDDGGQLIPVDVEVGVSDRTQSEVRGAALSEGLEIVDGIIPEKNAKAPNGNPFTPRLGGGRKR